MAINGLGGIGGFFGGIGGGAYSRPRIERTYIPTGADMAIARGNGGGGFGNNMGMGWGMMNNMMPCMFTGGVLPLFLLGGSGGGYGGTPCPDTNMASSMNIPMGQVF